MSKTVDKNINNTMTSSLLPSISVIMPVYNGAAHVAESIDSILAQTFTDFEFIIVDDASTDTTCQILQAYALKDTRIRVITNSTNMQIASSLNLGIDDARAPLIARMDADDWAYSERLATQFSFMQSHSRVAVCGTWLEAYETGDLWKYPITDVEIRKQLFICSPFGHPTVMFRKEVVKQCGGYHTSMPPAEDYDLWVTLASCHKVEFANIPVVLLRYRLGLTKDPAYYAAMEKQADYVRHKLCQNFWGATMTDFRKTMFTVLFKNDNSEFNDLMALLEYINSIYNQNIVRNFLNQKNIGELLRAQWERICERTPPTFFASHLFLSLLFFSKHPSMFSGSLVISSAKVVTKHWLKKIFRRLSV